MKLLSVVIPVFNMEKYLNQCIDSFLNCNNKDNLELLLIDDKSTDKSVGIINQYLNKYPSIVKLIKKESNSHHGGCINVAKKHVTGKYVSIIDSDDWINSKQLDFFLEKLKLDNDFYDVYKNKYNAYYFKDEKVEKINENVNDFTIHTICVKSEIFKNLDNLVEKVAYDDAIFTSMIFNHKECNKEKYCETQFNFYNYRLGRLGQTMLQDNEKMAIGTLFVMSDILINQNHNWLNLQLNNIYIMFKKLNIKNSNINNLEKICVEKKINNANYNYQNIIKLFYYVEKRISLYNKIKNKIYMKINK